MEANLERECSALGGMFQQIIADMKNGTPLWEDLVSKATKLHTCLRATIHAIAAYLDAFQKIADAATNARGATKEIGTALTRICLRHKAVEARMKTFTSAIMDCLVVPLQEKLEDWKKTVVNLDKEHAKEYKRARAELKKRSTDTLRLQKKVRKGVTGGPGGGGGGGGAPGPGGGDLQRRVEASLMDVNERRQLLEEAEKRAVRAALVEERSRFCLLVAFLKPVVDEEVAMLSELSHLQEVVDQVQKHTADPYALPPASEQVIVDAKGDGCSYGSGWTFQTPPSSPSSLGSRKSSMCSISSLNSSSSGSSKSHPSPSHHYWHRSLSQHPLPTSGAAVSSASGGGVSGQRRVGLSSASSSQDSGFTSTDHLLFPPPPPKAHGLNKVSNISEAASVASTPSTPACAAAVGTNSSSTVQAASSTTWPNLQDTLQFQRAATAIMHADRDRPHTISSAYERGHQRPPLTVYTFQAPVQSQPSSPVGGSGNSLSPTPTPTGLAKTLRPPIPQRCSSLERPAVPAKTAVLPPAHAAHAIKLPAAAAAAAAAAAKMPAQHLGHDHVQPMYVNMHELASLAAHKAQEQLPPPPPELTNPTPPPSSATTGQEKEPGEKDGSTSESSLESSSGYGSQTTIPVADDPAAVAAVAAINAAAPAEDAALMTVSSLELASKYCTLPRSGDLAQQVSAAVSSRRRPLSTAGYPSNTMRNTLLRRGSVQGQKPPPPIRRTSSISTSAVTSIAIAAAAAARAINNNNNNNNTAASTASSSCLSTSLENLPPPPAFLLESAAAGIPPAQSAQGVCVADTVRALTELKHQPASPVAVRRNSQSPLAPPTNQNPPTAAPLRSQSLDRRQSDVSSTASQGFIATLSAKLAPSLSPRNSRRVIANNTPPAQQHPMAPPAFLQVLNSKLAQQHQPKHQHQQQQQQHRASKVRQWVNSRAAPDPTTCHDSLMDQIKRGTTLRRTGPTNDRSAPKIR